MPEVKTKLSEIIWGMECPLDETGSFLNTRTGEVVNISFEDLRAAENDKPIEQFPEWQQEAQLTYCCIS